METTPEVKIKDFTPDLLKNHVDEITKSTEMTENLT